MEAIFYNKNFWNLYHSSRTKLAVKESVSKFKPASAHEIYAAYVSAFEDDMGAFLGWYKKFSVFQDELITAKIPFDYLLVGNSQFEAQVDFDSRFRITRITLSMALVIGIHDLMNRICASHSVLNFSSAGEDTWPGTTCFYPRSAIVPEIRFSLYRPKEDPTAPDNGSTLSLFFCGVPVGSEDRLYLASLMEFISLTWILFHEEAHYWQGHLFYLNFRNNASIDEVRGLSGDDPGLLKIFEWQADRGAIVDLVNMFFQAREGRPFELPDQFEDQYDLSNYIRIMICAIGSTIFIFQKNKLVSGSESHYPSPITRLTTLVSLSYSKLMELNMNGYLYGIEDGQTLERKIFEGLLNGLLDLYFTENVLTNEVGFSDGLNRVNFEAVNPTSLEIFKDIDEITEFLKAVKQQFSTGDKQLYGKWFEEYNEILAGFTHVYNHILPEYRTMAANNGESPYHR